MRALVVGQGSIGSRHLRLLAELGCEVAVVSGRGDAAAPSYPSITEGIGAFAPNYAVIATETARHLRGIEELKDAGFKGTLLVEKPLFQSECHIPKEPPQECFVAYNLRFHPLLRRLREILQREVVISAHAYVGQYLPLWRPGRDYRTVYSADRHAGGGALRDLSHELDLMNWLFGGWQKLAALGGRFSTLEISSDDVFSILMESERCPVVSIQLNYLDRIGQRRITVNTDKRTFVADLVAGYLMIDNIREGFSVHRDDSYREMHRTLLNGDPHDVCSFEEGLDVVRMIAAAERSVEEGRWLTR